MMIPKGSKLLYKDDNIQVIKTPPCRRTITFGDTRWSVEPNKSAFVPIPYQIYTLVDSKQFRHLRPNKQKTIRLFFTAFAKESDDYIYTMPFYRPTEIVCLDMQWHYTIPNNATFNEIISRFWSSFFDETEERIYKTFKVRNIKKWSELSIDEAIERLQSGQKPFNDFIKELKHLIE